MDVVDIVVRLVTAYGPDGAAIGDVHVTTDIASPLFVASIVCCHCCNRTPATGVLGSADNVWRVVLDRNVKVRVGIVAFFKRHDGVEAVATSECIADEVTVF